MPPYFYKLGPGDNINAAAIPGAPRILRPGQTFKSAVPIAELPFHPKIRERFTLVEAPAGLASKEPEQPKAPSPPESDTTPHRIEGDIYVQLAARLGFGATVSPAGVVEEIGFRLARLEAFEEEAAKAKAKDQADKARANAKAAATKPKPTEGDVKAPQGEASEKPTPDPAS